MFDSPEKLALGLLSGMAFGFLLQKGRVAKFPVIVGQFLLKDWTVVKIVGTATIVGSMGVYVLHATGLIELDIKPFMLGSLLVGGALFGIGIVVFGYCPGTGVAACGEGRRDAMVGVLGMLAGAGLYVATFGWLRGLETALGNYGTITFPQITSTSPWLWISGLTAVGVVAFVATRLRRTGKVAEQQRTQSSWRQAG